MREKSVVGPLYFSPPVKSLKGKSSTAFPSCSILVCEKKNEEMGLKQVFRYICI